MANLSPMMQQYMNIKERYPGALLFFRLGDFYEMFFEDALLASRELELTLTGRDCGLAERAPMCGVPHHSVQNYIARLLEKGHKVAICEQMQDPSEVKGLVERDVVRVITPGTIIEQGLLDERANNYLLALCLEHDTAGLAFADVSTGEFYAYQLTDAASRLADELARIAPKEVIANDAAIMAGLELGLSAPLTAYAGRAFAYGTARDALLTHFQVQSLMSFGLEEDKLAVCAAGALMAYLGETQKNALQHVATLRRYRQEELLLLDRAARRNLELTQSLRGQGKRGTLLALLDMTATAMGGRLLRAWVEQPLHDVAAIAARQDAVAALLDDHVRMHTLYEELRGIFDVERLLSKLSYRTLHARDALALCASLQKLPAVLALLQGMPDAALLRYAQDAIDPMEELTALLARAINPDAPLALADGNVIADGYDAELDALRLASVEGKQWIADLEAQEREVTGIKNLRVQYNRVFGYYFEVTKSNYELVPYRFTRKQTLANSERFTTPELAEIEHKILGAQDKALKLEQILFIDIRQQISACLQRLQRTAEGLKLLDALLSLALSASRYGYVRPEVVDDGTLHIVDGRHPVVEQALGGGRFVPNDTAMDDAENRMLIVTGPNMAGKSTYMRQVALIALMAHIGSFVPARSAHIGLIDRIFTRIGASDDLASGQSTFMVEMNEMANILRNATSRSLILLDEIGRGTSTFDGLSIAWAVVEHLCDPQHVGAKTLFATHYHELSELEGRLPGVVNFRVSVKEHGEDVIFLRKIVRGGADKSFGIHVARLAGLPQPVLLRAQEVLARLEAADVNQASIGQNILEEGRREQNEQVSLFTAPSTAIIEELRGLDVMSMTPMDAMNLLFALRERAKRI